MRVETFVDLGLALHAFVQAKPRVAPSLEQLLGALTAPHAVADYACDTCGMRGPAEFHMRLLRLPAVLVLQIQRAYSQADAAAWPLKDRTRVAYAAEIDLAPFLAFGGGGGGDDGDKSQAGGAGHARYRLGAVIEHRGEHSVGGHYTTYRAVGGWRHGLATHETCWVHCDDAAVTPVRAAQALGAEAALLVYSRWHDADA